jgi:hypothetical protein
VDAGRCGDGVVDPGERCDPGAQGCCDPTCGAVLPVDAGCRAATGSCDAEEHCDGLGAECPDDLARPDWAECSDCAASSSTACLGCYAGSCQPYLSPCLHLLVTGHSTGDGTYLLPSQQTGGAPQTVFCDMTTDGGGWTMLYKKSAGVAGDSALLWTDGGANADVLTLLGRARATLDYSSPLIGRLWPAFATARVELETSATPVRVLQFNALDSGVATWFSPERVTLSPWTDLPVSPTFQNGAGQFFSIQGVPNRSWYLNASWGTCDIDQGWMMNTSSNFCYWEGKTSDYPSEIWYASGTTRWQVADTTVFRRAEGLVVFAR